MTDQTERLGTQASRTEERRLSSMEPILSQVTLYLPSIVQALTNTDEAIDIQNVNLDVKRTGWRVGRFYDGRVSYFRGSDPAERQVDFFVKLFGAPEDGERAPMPLKMEHRLYQIMEGSGVVPRAFTFSELDGFLILEHGGRLTSEDKLASPAPEPDDSCPLEETILSNIAKFNAWAYQQASVIYQQQDIRRWVSEKRPTAERAIRYFTDFLAARHLEEDPERIRQFGEKYKVFERMYGENGKQPVHGDLRRQNIVGPSGEEWNEHNIKIVDLGLVEADPLYSVAQFITSPGRNADPGLWNTLMEHYKREEASQTGICGGRGIRFNREAMQRAYSRFYISTVHSSMRGLAKMAVLRNEFPKDHERLLVARPVLRNHDAEMFENLQTAVHYIARNTKELGFGSGEFNDVKCIEEAVNSYKEKVVDYHE